MGKMKHQDGYAPSAEDTAKLNEIITWLVDHGYGGIMLVHKGAVGVSWVSEPDAEAVRHLLSNSVGHIAEESEGVAVDLVKGIIAFADQIRML